MCYLWETDPVAREHWGGRAADVRPAPAPATPTVVTAAAKAALPASPCPHFGRRVRTDDGKIKQKWCGPCVKNLDLIQCHAGHGSTRGEVTLADCQVCRRDLVPQRTTRINTASLPGRAPHNQASIVRYNGRLVCAFRAGLGDTDTPSRVVVADLGEDFQPVAGGRVCVLTPSHPATVNGFEDPRLFEHVGRLYVAADGLSDVTISPEGGRKIGAVTMLYVLLRDDDLSIEREFGPTFNSIQPWEKNWGFFAHDDGQLYAVYTIFPHIVLRIDGDAAVPVARQNWPSTWTGGLMRGGAPPVRVGEEYWSWFYGVLEPSAGVTYRTYTVGVYAFEARAPFRPTRYTPRPVAWPDPADRDPRQPWFNVLFPCGAIVESELRPTGAVGRSRRMASRRHRKGDGDRVNDRAGRKPI